MYSRSNRLTISRRDRLVPRRNQISIRRRPVDPIIAAQRFAVPSAHIPQHTANPPVSRIIRIVSILTSGVSTATITYNMLALQDASDYNSNSNLRFNVLRVSQVRCWAESPNSLSVSQAPYGLIVIDALSGFIIRDRPTTGSRLAAVGMKFPFSVRSSFNAAGSTSSIVSIQCDESIATGTDFVVTSDFTVEFMA